MRLLNNTNVVSVEDLDFSAGYGTKARQDLNWEWNHRFIKPLNEVELVGEFSVNEYVSPEDYRIYQAVNGNIDEFKSVKAYLAHPDGAEFPSPEGSLWRENDIREALEHHRYDYKILRKPKEVPMPIIKHVNPDAINPPIFVTRDWYVKRVEKNIINNAINHRIDREEARQALFYETIGSVCEALPLPEFEPLYAPVSDKDYLLCVSDIHYGATFNSANNTYSREIAKERIEQLTGDTIQFIIEHQLNNIHVACLGDCVQGMLRLSDISLNDTSVVKCVVEISRLLANMLNQISKYATVNYYHVPTSNHTQTRPIGTKASEMPQEDLEYVIGHYISDLLIANSRVLVHLEEDNEYIKIPIFNYNIVALHGHQCGALVDEIKKLSVMNREFIDFLVLGHQHSSKELIGFEQSGYDAEILVAPAICGSDPYSDKLRVGAKPSAKIFGFDEVQGHTETYKFVL